MDKLRAYLGRFHYKKWVLHYRYKQQFDDSATPIWNVAFLAMFGGMAVDNHARKQNAAVNAYNVRKDNVAAAERKLWAEQRAHYSLNVAELEESVFRVRKGEEHPDVLDKDGLPVPFDSPVRVTVSKVED